MKEIHVLAFVQTERKDGVTVYHRRSNKVAFTDIVKALDAAENQCFAMFDQYRNHGYNMENMSGRTNHDRGRKTIALTGILQIPDTGRKE